MIKHTPKHQIKVGGKMSTEGANTVGKMLAWAAIIVASGVACFGISFIL